MLFQTMQICNQFDHHKGLATSRGHPETHAVDQVVVLNQISLGSDEFGQDSKYLILFPFPPVGLTVVFFQVG